MESHGFYCSSPLHLPWAPNPPQNPPPLQLLAECSLVIASRSLLSSKPHSTSFQRFRDTTPITGSNIHRSGPPPLLLNNLRMKRKRLQTMDINHPSDGQQQQQGTNPSNTFPKLIFTTNLAPGPGEESGLNTLICAAQSSVPNAIPSRAVATDARPSILPTTLGALKAASVCSDSSSSSCCDRDDCSDKCDDEDCNKPCEDCMDSCEIVPRFCEEEACLGQRTACPEDDSCVQEIICQKDGCEVTGCHPPDYGYPLNGGGMFQSFADQVRVNGSPNIAPGWAPPVAQQFAHHGSVEPMLLALDFQNHQLQLNSQLQQPHYSNQQLTQYPTTQLNNHMQQIAPEPSESSRSSSALLECYGEFGNNSPFDYDYPESSKRRRVSGSTPMTSPSFDQYTAQSSKPGTPFSSAEPLNQWNYNSPRVQTSWDENDLLNTNNLLNTSNIFSSNLLDLGDCHWDGCNFHFSNDEDLQLHLSTHLDISGELDQCLWDACGTEVHGIDDLKEHLQHEHLVPPDIAATESSTVSSPSPCSPSTEGPKRCEWLTTSNDGHQQPCGKSFTNAEGLQKHAKDEHIAALKKKTGYFCGWADCGRRDRSFSQKGKVERHMQTHTGCKQNDPTNLPKSDLVLSRLVCGSRGCSDIHF